MNWLEITRQADAFVQRTDRQWLEIEALVRNDLSTALRVKELHAVVTLACTRAEGENAAKADLPADYRYPVSVEWGAHVLEPTSYLTVLELGGNTAGGRPYFYAIDGGRIFIASGSGDVRLTYGGNVSQITGDGDSNEITLRYPRCYVAGLVRYGFLQIQDFESAAAWAQEFAGAVMEANDSASAYGYGPGVAP